MSLEGRVERLELHFDSLDSAVRSLINITGETHQIVLENQRENRLRFQQIDNRFEQIDNRFEQIDNRFEQIDNRFEQIDNRFEQIDNKFEQIGNRFEQVDNRFEQVDNRFEQIEQRLSQQDRVIAANQQETRERFDQLELLIRQSFPKN